VGITNLPKNTLPLVCCLGKGDVVALKGNQVTFFGEKRPKYKPENKK
jgi:hypothetical protein